MTQMTVCDSCGDSVHPDDGSYYNVNRYTEEITEVGDFCPDCLPDSLQENLETETFEQ